MKLVRFGEQGAERPGIIDGQGRIRDASAVTADYAGEGLSRSRLVRLANVDLLTLPVVENVRLGPPVAGTRNFIGVGLNYADHAAETGAAIPAEPILFNKTPSSIVGPNDDVIIPRGSEKTDWEVEIAVAIGAYLSYATLEQAAQGIAGYMVCHDVSERGYQLDRGGQWIKGKGCPSFGPIGPWLVTPDEIPDVQNLDLWLDVNGRRMQSGSSSRMIFGIRFLVSYISRFMRLEPGDVITTGTPPGVGMARQPPLYLRAGDRVELGVQGLGAQAQRVVQDEMEFTGNGST